MDSVDKFICIRNVSPEVFKGLLVITPLLQEDGTPWRGHSSITISARYIHNAILKYIGQIPCELLDTGLWYPAWCFLNLENLFRILAQSFLVHYNGRLAVSTSDTAALQRELSDIVAGKLHCIPQLSGGKFEGVDAFAVVDNMPFICDPRCDFLLSSKRTLKLAGLQDVQELLVPPRRAWMGQDRVCSPADVDYEWYNIIAQETLPPQWESYLFPSIRQVYCTKCGLSLCWSRYHAKILTQSVQPSPLKVSCALL